MCLAMPAEIVALDAASDTATISLGGVRKEVSTVLVQDVAIGEFVLVHVGYALHKVSSEEAARTLALMEEAGLLDDELEELTA